jgi:ABC-2 type transport system ATP-binding protein
VVLDEPTNGLDPQGRDEMLELVRRLSRDLGIRVLFSSHVLEDVERTCDAVVVLRDGRVAAQGRISDLRGREAGSARLSAVGDLVALRAALVARGVGVEDGEDGWLAVRADPSILPDAVRDACADAGVSLRALLPGDRTLEEAVIGAIA